VVAGLVPIGVAELLSVEVAVVHNKSRQTNTLLAVADRSTIVVAELVPEVDRVDIADLFANRVAADLVMAVVENAVVYNRDAITDTILADVDPCTIVVAELVPEFNQVDIADLFANRVAADLVMAVVEVAVVYNRDAITDTILAVVDPCTIVIAELVPEFNQVDSTDLFANHVLADVVMAVAVVAVE